MKVLSFETIEQLSEYIEGLGTAYLFRGQTKEYLDDKKQPTLSTSFNLKGCLPPNMLKWTHHAKLLLQYHITQFDGRPDLATDQAILQHYGWRSFFIDATSSAAVACWFAANTFQADRQINLAEDCWEDPVFAVHLVAKYSHTSDVGVVYVISKKALRHHSIQAVDLNEIVPSSGHTRYMAQRAWMVGPLKATLPVECIEAKLLLPAEMLRAYASKQGFNVQGDLFPDTDSDPVLAALLSQPWVQMPVQNGDNKGDKLNITFFKRGLQLPEYSWKPIKRHSPAVTFYRPFWLANEHGNSWPFGKATYILLAEWTYYGVMGAGGLRFPTLAKILDVQRPIIIEIDNLVLYPHRTHDAEYAKGICMQLKSDGYVEISEVVVGYAGMRPAGYGLSAGRSYKITGDGSWQHEAQADDCPCGNDIIHGHHLIVLSHVEQFLAEGEVKKVNERLYVGEDVDQSLNLNSLKISSEVERRYFEAASKL